MTVVLQGGGVFTSLAAHVVLFAGALVVVAVSLWWSIHNREKVATTEFTVFLLTVFVWTVLQLAELLGGQTVAYYATFAIRAVRALMAVSWLYFTTTYAGYGETVHSWPVRLLAASGTLILLLLTAIPQVAMTVIFERALVSPDPVVTVTLAGGTPLKLFTQMIGYSMVIIGTGALAYRLVETRYKRWWQPLAIVGVVAAGLATDIAVKRTVSPVQGVDYAILGATVAAVLFIFVLYRDPLFGFSPVARDHVFHTFDDPVFVLDPDRTIIDYNDSASEITDDPIEVGAAAARHLPYEPGERDGDGTIDLAVDGEQRHYDVVTSELTTVGATGGEVIILRDITAQKERERALERQNERLEDFASIVSHDLRNPLEVARGRAELARAECDSEHLDDVLEAHQRMAALIDDLLTLAREGEAVTEPEPVSLAETIPNCWRTVSTGDATLSLETDRTVLADPNRLKQLLENLFANAVEHGGEGVTVTVGDLESGFYVEDDGRGIPPEERAKVFQSGYSTSADGTGFGLNIAAEIADAHGWEIVARGGDSGGARFEVTGVESPDAAPDLTELETSDAS